MVAAFVAVLAGFVVEGGWLNVEIWKVEVRAIEALAVSADDGIYEGSCCDRGEEGNTNVLDVVANDKVEDTNGCDETVLVCLNPESTVFVVDTEENDGITRNGVVVGVEIVFDQKISEDEGAEKVKDLEVVEIVLPPIVGKPMFWLLEIYSDDV